MSPIGAGSIVEISVIGLCLDQTTMNVFQYEAGSVPAGTTASQIGEAYWNHVKTTYRGLCPTVFSGYFRTIKVVELNDPEGAYGEYTIPSGERGGTRNPGSANTPLPAFAAVGMRLSVASRATRPGQKRFPFVTEEDNDYGQLSAGIISAANALGAVLSTTMTLGAPAALATLKPIIVRKDITGAVVAQQDVVGYIVNPFVTSQVSRKPGRGQ
jgi:hypothetical protein